MGRKSRNIISHRRDPVLYRDLRSAGHPLKRERVRSIKYYGFRGVKPSWLGQEYLDVDLCKQENPWLIGDPLLTMPPEDIRVKTWTKRDMWEERDHNIWPLDRRHSKGRWLRERRSNKWEKTMQRGMRQRSRRIQFACDEAEIMAREDDDADTTYWAGEEWLWANGGVEQIRDEDGKGIGTLMDLEGERFRRDMYDGVGEWLKGVQEEMLDVGDDGVVFVGGVEDIGEGFSEISGQDEEEFEMSSVSDDDGFVEVGRLQRMARLYSES